MAFNMGPVDKDNPCKRDCPQRTSDCHGKCPEYKKFRDRKDAELEEKNQRHIATDTMSEAKKRAIWRKMRNSRQVRYNKGKEV